MELQHERNTYPRTGLEGALSLGCLCGLILNVSSSVGSGQSLGFKEWLQIWTGYPRL